MIMRMTKNHTHVMTLQSKYLLTGLFPNAQTKNVFSSACLPIPPNILKGKYENYDECQLPQSWQPLIAATLGGDKKFAAATEPKNWFPRPLDLADDYPDTAPKRKSRFLKCSA